MVSSVVRILSLVLSIAIASACTQSYKPVTARRTLTKTENTGTGGAIGSEDQGGQAGKVAKPSGLVLANSKLMPVGGPLSAKISLGSQSITQQFSPTGDSTLIDISTLPATANGILTVEISQGNVLKFVAKKAQIAFNNPKTDGIIVDDCNILPAPWDGKTNDGSCAWSIAEGAP